MITWFRYAAKRAIHLTQEYTQLTSTYHLALSRVPCNPDSYESFSATITTKFVHSYHSSTEIFASVSSRHKHWPIRERFNPDANCLQSDRLTRRSFVRNRITDTPRPRSAHARAALPLPQPTAVITFKQARFTARENELIFGVIYPIECVTFCSQALYTTRSELEKKTSYL